ncbi:MAG TPA: exopolysaccharide biosynthesis polyprenyl glycosylphosphotransferase [Chthoniobacterales bacterium]
MLSYRVRGLNHVYYCFLAGALTLFFWIYLFCLRGVRFPSGGFNFGQYVIYNAVALVALAGAAVRASYHIGHVLSCDARSNHGAALVNCTAVGSGILLLMAATKDVAISRAFLFSFLPLLYVVFFFCHRFIPGFLHRRFFRKHYRQRALLVGSLDKVERLDGWRAQMAAFGVEFTCFLQGFGEVISTVPDTFVLLERVIRRERIGQVVLLGLPDRREVVLGLMALCNRLGLRLLVVNGLGEFFERPVTQSRLCGVDVIDVMKEPLEDPFNRLIKRGLDLALATLVVGLLLPPLIAVVWLAQRLQSPGPLFYRQTRSGHDNHPFRIVKFRSMHSVRRAHARQAGLRDSRVFSFGRFLRQTSLDEIPQFLNVLRGEMSVVGPRPHMIIHNRRFCRAIESYHVRAFVKPGITGCAQVRGCRGEAKTDADIETRVRFDLDYIERWSIWRDFAIILETARQVLFPPKTAC